MKCCLLSEATHCCITALRLVHASALMSDSVIHCPSPWIGNTCLHTLGTVSKYFVARLSLLGFHASAFSPGALVVKEHPRAKKQY